VILCLILSDLQTSKASFCQSTISETHKTFRYMCCNSPPVTSPQPTVSNVLIIATDCTQTHTTHYYNRLYTESYNSLLQPTVHTAIQVTITTDCTLGPTTHCYNRLYTDPYNSLLQPTVHRVLQLTITTDCTHSHKTHYYNRLYTQPYNSLLQETTHSHLTHYYNRLYTQP
jgi:hypothetical protein